MIKIFFITFFIAELIIAFAILFGVWKFDRKIVKLEKEISGKQNDIRAFLFEMKNKMRQFNETMGSLRQILLKKQQEIALGLIKQAIIFLGIFLLKDKYRKRFLALNIIIDIYSEIKDELQTA